MLKVIKVFENFCCGCGVNDEQQKSFLELTKNQQIGSNYYHFKNCNILISNSPVFETRHTQAIVVGSDSYLKNINQFNVSNNEFKNITVAQRQLKLSNDNKPYFPG